MTLELDSVTFQYPLSTTPALWNISFTVEPGMCLLVLGHNGAGKSTLLRLLNGILRPAHGSVLLDGAETRNWTTAALARSVAVTFQNPSDQIFASTVRDEAVFGPRNLGRPRAVALAEEALERFGLADLRDRHPYDLRPAQRKLLSLASAVAMDSSILAFDEPGAGLSFPERQTARMALSHEAVRKKSLLVVTHDIETWLPIATHVLLLRQGRIVFLGRSKGILGAESALRRAGVRLPASWRISRLLGESRLT